MSRALKQIFWVLVILRCDYNFYIAGRSRTLLQFVNSFNDRFEYCEEASEFEDMAIPRHVLVFIKYKPYFYHAYLIGF